VLFRVVIGHETTIRDGWNHVRDTCQDIVEALLISLQLVLIILNLFVNSLLTIPYSSISSNTDVPPIPLQSPAQVVERGDRANEGGLFSALSSYVSSFANDEPPEPSDQEIEYTLCTVDCVKACSFESLFSNIRYENFAVNVGYFLTRIVNYPLNHSKVLFLLYSSTFRKTRHRG